MCKYKFCESNEENFSELENALMHTTQDTEQVIKDYMNVVDCDKCKIAIYLFRPHHVLRMIDTNKDISLLELLFVKEAHLKKCDLTIKNGSASVNALKICVNMNLNFIVHYLIDKFHPKLGKSLLNSAADNGNYELMKLLHENGCEWSVSVVKNACRGGHYKCLYYACVNGCLDKYLIE